jgi:wyosine [tRNA(Phe)-imidazoG37] synthetase (radical SAM superfamily)
MGQPYAAELKKVVYGPVPSWRLGRSLGIDLLSRPKTCTFDCIYCQLGPTRYQVTRREEFVPTRQVLAELKALPPIEVDYITFSGMGEPTLAANLGETIRAVRKLLPWPVAVLSNASLLTCSDVQNELSQTDCVVVKLDASDPQTFEAINRPHEGITLSAILQGIREFRTRFWGRLALQIMFCAENQNRAYEIARLARHLEPDEVQLNTPLRPSTVSPLSPEEMQPIKEVFMGMRTVSVYEAQRISADILNIEETTVRRPVKPHNSVHP